MKFDYIVANPPFKIDYSDWRDELDTKENLDSHREFQQYQDKILPKKKYGHYTLFIQHIIYSMADKGKAAIVVQLGLLHPCKAFLQKF